MANQKQYPIQDSDEQSLKLSEEQLAQISGGYESSTEHRMKCGVCGWTTGWQPIAVNITVLGIHHCNEKHHSTDSLIWDFR